MNIYTANPQSEFIKYQLEIESSVLRVLRNGKYILGNELVDFENSFKDFIGTNFAIGVANGTDAIEIALRALDIGIDDEVITVSHTAVPTVAAIVAAGAKPVLVDIEKDFYTIDPQKIRKSITNKTKAIIAVHLYGQPCDLEQIKNICDENNIKLIEDVSQAHGSYYFNKKLGCYGDIACFSCYPTKNLGALGDAGVLVTNNPNLGEKCRLIRQYGWKKEVSSEIFGRNSRLDEIQAAILNVKLKYLENHNTKRNYIANYYSKFLSELPIKIPQIRENSTHVFHLYVIQVEKRDLLIKYLNKNGIFPGIHYPYPVHQQKTYKKIAKFDDLEITDYISNKILSLPIYPELTIEDVTFISGLIKDFYKINL